MEQKAEFFLKDGEFFDAEGNEVGLQEVIDSGGVVYTEDGESFVP